MTWDHVGNCPECGGPIMAHEGPGCALDVRRHCTAVCRHACGAQVPVVQNFAPGAIVMTPKPDDTPLWEQLRELLPRLTPAERALLDAEIAADKAGAS